MKFEQVVTPTKRVKVDLKDKKILHMLSDNSRSSYTHIAKHVGLSRDAVKYRITQLEKAGVIQGYRTVIDIKKLGYNVYHLFLQLNKPSFEVEKNLIEHFKNHPLIRAVIKFNGQYDFEIAMIAKDMNMFEEELENILDVCHEYLQDYDILIVSKGYVGRTFPLNFYKGEHAIKKQHKEYKLDKKDLEIIKIMTNNATVPLYKVSQKTKLSVDAVNYRIKKMVSAGIILKFIPVINYSALGYQVYAITIKFARLDKKEQNSLRQFVNTDENVLWATKVLGKYNCLIYICTEDPNDLHTTLNNLRNHFPNKIRKYVTLLAYEEYKYTYYPEELGE